MKLNKKLFHCNAYYYILYIKFSFIIFFLLIIKIFQLFYLINYNNKSNEMNFFSNQRISINSYLYQEKLQSYKIDLLNALSSKVKKKIKKVIILKLTHQLRFGNCFASLNNAIFSCEILTCQKIIIESPNCFINNAIYYKERNITIEIDKEANCSKSGVVCVPITFFFYYRYKNFEPRNRFFLLQNEILNNIPKRETHRNDLYIHIRSGDIFVRSINSFYAQPPLCFYEKIITNYKFRKIFIVSENKNNPVIDLLLFKYPRIQYVHNDDLRVDISYLLNAFNLVSSTSSFSTALVNLSKNLKILFEYDIILESEKKLFFHYDYQKYEKKYIRIQMKPSDNYKSKMLPWNSTEKQKHAMINETCNSQFIILF